MRLRYHRLTGDAFRELAAGGGGPAAIHELAAVQYSKHVLLLRGVVDASRAARHSHAAEARSGYALLSAVQRDNPAAAEAVIKHPSVGSWALRTVQALRRDDPALASPGPTGLCAVAAAAAIRAGFPAEIEVPAARGAVILPSLGAAIADGDAAIVRTGAGGAEVVSSGHRVDVPADPHRSALGWSALRRLRVGAVEILIDDLDPFRMFGTAEVAPRLTVHEADMWNSAFQESWSLLQRHHPAIAAEAAAAIRVIVPLAVPPHGQVSSSSDENFGAVALSPPPDSRTFGVTLAHEMQHLKLSALLDVTPLTLPDDGRRFYAPWREDPRPVRGLLQGTYAFLGVTAFWRRQRHLDGGLAGLRAHAEFARWRTAALRVADTLRSSGRLTAAGQDFVRGMAGTLHLWEDEPIPAEARMLARQEADQHLARWQLAHGLVPAWSPRSGI